jgi:hypothetical protein
VRQLARLAEDDLPQELLDEIKRKVPIDAFCELVAAMFNLGTDSGEQVVEMCFHDGGFRWSRVHSGRIGRDQLDRLRNGHAPTMEDPAEVP